MRWPTEEELKAIEAEWIDKQLKEDTSQEWLEEIVEATKDEVSSYINNISKTWCEAASNLDWSYSSSCSKLNNADELWNTPNPSLWSNKDK